MADEETFITAADLAALRTRDPRWEKVQLSIKLDTELRESLALNLIIEAAARRAHEALEKLADVDVTDTKKLISLQADVQRAKLIGEILRGIKESGEDAYSSLKEQERMESENRS